MFKAIKGSKIIAIDSIGKFPCMIYDELVEDSKHQISDYIMVGDEYVLLNDTKAIKYLEVQIRQIRNNYLTETDKFLSILDFPITEEQKTKYREYRQYLREYPQSSEDWYLSAPKSFEDWNK